MYRADEVIETLEGHGTLMAASDTSATIYTEDSGVHGLITVEDLLDGRPPTAGGDLYKVRYRGVDTAAGRDFTDTALLAGSIPELDRRIETVKERLYDAGNEHYGHSIV